MNIVFALLLTVLSSASPPPLQKVAGQKQVPTIQFCELVKHPEAYFNRPIRIAATMGLGAEGSTLYDARCSRSHNHRIGVGFVELSRQDKSLEKQFELIRNGQWDANPRVVIVGILRNKSRRDFESYRYRFDLIRVESVRRNPSEKDR